MMLRILYFCLKLGLFFGLIGAFTAAYIVYYYSRDLPDYSQLQDYHPPCVTRMYSSDGYLIEEYAKENRIFVPIQSMPQSLRQAFIAAEDKNFYSHPGIDIFSIARAAILNVSHILKKRRVEGGSTITQQVVKNFLLSSQRSLERKVKEAILSYMISQSLNKDQILELYLNQIYLGKGAYGVAAAALVYFDKSVEELTLTESAVLASLPKAPSKYNPEKDYQRAVERKNYVIGRMFADGYISEQTARVAINEPIKLAKHDKNQTIDADYYAEQVREEVVDMFGSEYFYTAGLTIITALDSKLQKQAEKSLCKGILDFDRKRGYRGPIKNIDLVNWQDDLRELYIPLNLKNDKMGVVLSVDDKKAKFGFADGSKYELSIQDMKWTKTNLKSVKQILKVGDVIAVTKKGKGKYILSQPPEVNGALMVMEPVTGRVLAMQGGYDFDSSKFNRATQAKRQPGSLIKAFVYLAALENGYRPNEIFEDAPIEISQGPGLPKWTPKNDDSTFLGPITLRRGIERSRNLITIRVGLAVGIGKLVETIRRFGLNDNPPKLNSLMLGALETTLERATNAFTIIASGGKRVTPHYIELIKDRKGNVIYRRDYNDCPECKHYALDENGNIMPPEIEEAKTHYITDAASNYQITSLLRGVVLRGSGYLAKKLKQPVYGKTGTTNDAKDTWFIGFTPRMVVGTYVGYDQPRSLGKRAYGANTACPIFVDFMENGYKDYPPLEFEPPKTIQLVKINYETGIPGPGEKQITEAFKVNNYDPLLDQLEHAEVGYDVFSKIQDKDTSQEVY